MEGRRIITNLISYYVHACTSTGCNKNIELMKYLEKHISYNTYNTDGCRYESNCPLVGPGTIGGMPSVGGLSKGS